MMLSERFGSVASASLRLRPVGRRQLVPALWCRVATVEQCIPYISTCFGASDSETATKENSLTIKGIA